MNTGIFWTPQEIIILKRHLKPNRTHFQVYLECVKDGLEGKNFNAFAGQIRRIKYDAAIKIFQGGKGSALEKCKTEIAKPFRIGYLDIETTALDSFGDILTWCIKERDGNIISSVITKKEILNYRKTDRRLIKELCEAISGFDYIYTFYGGDYHFDLPFIRTKAISYGMEHLFPGYGRVHGQDLYGIAKKKLRSRRYSLAVLCQMFGIKGKTPLDTTVWKRAKVGDTWAINEVLRHNKGDVIITEKLHKKLETFAQASRTSI